MRILLALLLMLSVSLSVLAQDATLTPEPTLDPDLPVAGAIGFDEPIKETITQVGFFDRWQIALSANDVIEVQMQAEGGLEPLIGILNPGQDLQARSDM